MKRISLFALVALSSISTAFVAGCSSAESDVASEVGAVTSTTAKFEIFKGLDGKNYFHLLAGNGQNVLRSEAYESKQAAEKGVASVMKNGADAANFEILEAKDGSFYFNIKAGNNEIIGTSEMYASKSNATRGADTVRKLVRLADAKAKPTRSFARVGKFVGEDNQPYFNVRAGNGEIILTSEGYSSASKRDEGVATMLRLGKDAANYEVFEAKNGQFGVRLKSGNNEIVAHGELYVSKSNANRAVKTMVDLLTEANGGTVNRTDSKDLIGDLKKAAFGIDFISETDSDLHVLLAPNVGTAAIDAALVVDKFGADADKLMTDLEGGEFKLADADSIESSAKDFLDHITQDFDPNDPDSIAAAKAAKPFRTLVEKNLSDMKVIRFFNKGADINSGAGLISELLVGRTADGSLVAVQVFSVET